MGKRVLVVDDSPVMRKMIGEILEGNGHEIVGVAKNGSEGVSFYKVFKPDVVTMDITMRGTDGLAAAKEILSFDPNAKIIFLSNVTDEKFRNNAFLIGARGYVNKNESKKILTLIASL